MKWFRVGINRQDQAIKKMEFQREEAKRLALIEEFAPRPDDDEMVELEGWENYHNCFCLNPHTGESTGHLMNFYRHPHDGTVWPQAITKGPYRNVSELPIGEPSPVKIPRRLLRMMYLGNR